MGIIGIILDRPRTLAIVVTVIASLFILFYIFMIGLIMFCRA